MSEEKFPALSKWIKERLSWSNDESHANELRELLAFWDAHQWIPISTPPQNGGKVLLWDASYKRADLGFFDKDQQCCFAMDRMPLNHVTHWAPLPKYHERTS